MKYTILVTIALSIGVSHCFSQGSPFENYYITQGVHPENTSAFWFPDKSEVQGVTNDGEHWFITLTKFENTWGDQAEKAELWRIPKSVPLEAGSGSSSDPGVDHLKMEDIPALAAAPYWHFGDPDHYVYNGEDYILVPTYPSDGNGVIACFRANPLEFISYAPIPLRPGWCAIDPDGYLYSSGSATDHLKRFSVNWDVLTSPGNNSAIGLSATLPLSFLGNTYNELEHMQGGEFSESGNLLYIACGAAGGCAPIPGNGCGVFDRKAGPGSPKPSDGLHVFDTDSWNEIQRSTKSSAPEDHFVFSFDNDLTGQQPQGVTVWDLDDGSAPGPVKGKLHVFVFDYDFDVLDPGDHEFTMYHFSNIVYVSETDGVNPPTSGIGREYRPFQTFNDAFFYFPIWDGAEIVLEAGSYNDTGTYDKKVLIRSEGGSAIIGQ